MVKRALVIGNLTIDHNLTESGRIISPGGSSFFIAKTFENFDLYPTVVSPYGSDFPKKYLPKTMFYPSHPTSESTLIFKNHFNRRGSRLQWADNFKDNNINIFNPPFSVFLNKDIVVIAPIIPNITYTQIKDWKDKSKNSLFVFTPQGLFRKIEKFGEIKKKLFIKSFEYMKLFDAVIVSEDDYIGMEKRALVWNTYCPIVIVTKKDYGADLYIKCKRYPFPAFNVANIIDSTGCGDVFCAAFSYAYLETKDPFRSCEFANCTTAFSLLFPANNLKYSYQDILAFADKQERTVKI